MYPCSNPELVAAASEAGAIGIVQPVSMVFVYRHEFRAGLRLIRSLTSKPIGLNVIVEGTSKVYLERSRQWLDIALEEGVRFFITALGNPDWVVAAAHAKGGLVYHDVTERKWAERAAKSGVDGFICVNNQAGGHAGRLSPEQLFADLKDMGKPLICAGGIGSASEYRWALAIGYQGVQCGTRFIAATECKAHEDYKQAILKAKASDIVLTDKISGVPVSIIKTPYIERTGIRAGFLARFLLRGRKTKHWMRLYYTLKSVWQLKNSSIKGSSYKDFFQAGKSVETIDSVETVATIVRDFVR